ncbi:hypothetical protein A3C25_05175 [Candidatus Roizmanbacteria bacterium RIFCSPHIGHO2_02_FULL_38_11]|uniref:Uncharacterized protein n=1 Tax=Candidatus Roizmanbacteria bacterium RIFCSPHIGHO2_02_FULL_38_11 TaxID=1802039 RepID=A0A1F7GZ51_9BACT|nr:MAG: hypothetical protein A3C25_05175 [Candidatus Roizmanbacteria bacterium RIFCSPHIGHO2_02_FULL_38_11]
MKKSEDKTKELTLSDIPGDDPLVKLKNLLLLLVKLFLTYFQIFVLVFGIGFLIIILLLLIFFNALGF